MSSSDSSPNLGYYRFPTLTDNTIVFTAEGDLWKVDAVGGIAQRLTTHHGVESHPAISPDGMTLAFSAQYEGATEVYSMPLAGGRPTRHTYEGETALVVGWTPKGQILYSTKRFSTLPNTQLAIIDPQSGAHELIPLQQASEGSITPDGKTLFFTRLPFQGSNAKRYQGGSVENIWRFPLSKRKKKKEAVPLTADYLGTSKAPMVWEGRVFFASDRDGTMNLWSMDKDGGKLRQHTTHSGWDIKSPALHGGRIVYQAGADIYLYTIANDRTQLVPISLASDFDQTRARWISDPLRYLDNWSISPAGDRIALTARGRIFVFPTKQGRNVEVTRKHGVHYRDATFLPDGKSLIALSDESGELEFCRFPVNGIGEADTVTNNGDVFRFAPRPSPDGKQIAFYDKRQELWITDLKTKKSTKIAASEHGSFYGLSWSPDSQWLAYTVNAGNGYRQIWLYSLTEATHTAATSDRVDSASPAWSPDGNWLYFLSHRHFESLVQSPWGQRQPEPYLEQTQKIYMVALKEGLRSPFQPEDELVAQVDGATERKAEKPKKKEKETKASDETKGAVEVQIEIAVDGLAGRLFEVPLAPRNFWGLTVTGKHLYWGERAIGKQPKSHIRAIEIKNRDIEVQTIFSDVRGYEISADQKKILVRKNDLFYVFDTNGEAPKKVEKQRVRLNGWRFAIEPREEWRQILTEAWRLERDYFYDPTLHGVDWQAQLERHLPLVDRVRDREELDDLIAHLISELAALHTGIRGGDKRSGREFISIGSLGARLLPVKNGVQIEHIYRSDPDYPTERGPLERPDLGIHEGDIIEAINGVETTSVAHPALLLQNQVGKQVLLRVRPAKQKPKETKNRDVVVVPISSFRESHLRYGEWEYQRRKLVEEQGKGEIGYVHLRAMSGENYTEWVKNFYPIFNRNGLIVDVRHNRGGNIDSWILEKLIRRAWFYWQPRVGKPYWNMQLAFRGHMVVLCNERTASDGETLAEGFRRLGLGKVIGTRTWGGGIWLSPNTRLVDNGLARTAQIGVFTPDGEWAIEGHGVDPDIVVDNLPHATFKGGDAQLDAAIAHLQTLLSAEPIPELQAPAYPDKSFEYK